ncbi:NYN domain-containing protein [Phycicoccus avicenniae]|uniref:NYN domain-containing protein n=1 Tax=Phycicoccus avicenniae TaxID=2828860 RepID=UPI003D2966F9
MRRSALFIDFDNFFSGLLGADPAAALRAVENPGLWLRGLVQGVDPATPPRRWLILRCYLNPNGSVEHPRDPARRLYFSNFRPFFTQAGVEVVDCPSLTRGAKNGADIRIAVDAMTALQSPVPFDELVIASSDADFTPLLQVVRANDKRITVIATSTTAPAYESLADEVLDESDLFALASGGPVVDLAPGPDIPAPPQEAAPELPEPDPAAPAIDPEEAAERFADVVRARYAAASEPLNLTSLVNAVVIELGPAPKATNWFGNGTFGAALRALDLPSARFSQHHLWDSERHEAPSPVAPPTAPPPPVAPSSALPPTVARIAAVTGLPRIASEKWPVVCSTLEAYRVTHDFDFTEATKWARDQAAAEGHEISRQAFSYVVRACRYAGTPMTAEPAPDAETIGRALLESVLRQADLAGFEVDAKDRGRLAEWLHVPTAPDGPTTRPDGVTAG